MMNMKIMRPQFFINFALITSLLTPVSAVANEGIFGEWMADNGKTRIITYACADNAAEVCSAITWLKRPRKDINNKNPALRNRDVVGLEVGKNMKPKGENRWVGEVYSDKRGETFPSTARLEGDVLKIKGCLTKRKFICKTRTFDRIAN
ncbi:MAG: DUF2147 domain-containing protein [Hyphomicrobiales bacterium]